MNKTIALLIVGVILLAMALIIVNQYATQPPEPPSVGTPAMSSPPTALRDADPTSSLAPSNSPMPEESKGLGMTATPSPAVPGLQSSPQRAQAFVQEASPPPASRPAIPQWATNLQEQPAGNAGDTRATPSPVAEPAAPRASATENAKAEAPKPKVQTPKAEAPKPKVETPKAEAPKPKVETPKAEAPKPKGPKTISKIAIFSAGDTVTVRLNASEMPEYKTMHLKSPERLVVDLEGEWNIRAPGVPTNKFVSNVRIGKQKNSTRIVIDLQQTPAGVRYLKKGTTDLDIRFK